MRYFILVLVALITFAGCSSGPQLSSVTPRPAPTIAPFFSGAQRPVPTIEIPSPIAGVDAMAGDPLTSDAASLQATAQRDPSAKVVAEVTIFNDRLDPNWSLEDSWGSRLYLGNLTFVTSGRSSLEVIPLEAFGGVLFTIAATSSKKYPRADVLGVRFAISGGANYLSSDSLIVKVTGSNRYPFFVEGDQSVWPSDDPNSSQAFAEVGLDSLGLRRDLEPGEWAEVELWLDGYDIADYTYVTSINVMNAPSYMNRYYIDSVRLLVRRP